VVQSIIKEQKPIESLGIEGEVLTTWTPLQRTESYRDGNPVRTYHWELTEKEMLQLESLRLGELTLSPYEYKESFNDQGELTIDARTRLTPAELQSLRALPYFFSIVRKGISDTPREMRFGRLLWSDHGDHIKHDIFLVERQKSSDKKLGGLLQPEMYLWESAIALNAGLVNSLIDTLKTKGLLNDEEIDQLKKQAADSVEDRMRHFQRVNDLDEWE
jgi:hypothetical protein